ncbi:MAG: biotin--[acetyl-CoA-carboxylase] ligase [Bacteroidales bacterium]|nr:biotin--[acetyl-CoA-carboxylase] ligase [Bacteroidales bacterium]
MDRIFEPQYIWLESVDSTNSYCMKLAQEGEQEGLAVAAFFQEKGRGQRGNTWESERGENLTFSLLLRPSFLRVEEQFMISKAIALSICDWLKNNNVDARVKWPNDIYVGDKKIAGVLIENSFSSTFLDISIIGIGMNLNQIVFSSNVPNPISMTLLTGFQYRPEVVLSELVVSIQMRYLQLKCGLKEKISDDYLKSLYRFQNLCNYSSADGNFKAKIIGIKPTGELILEMEDGQKKSFGFKEIIFEI